LPIVNGLTCICCHTLSHPSFFLLFIKNKTDGKILYAATAVTIYGTGVSLVIGLPVLSKPLWPVLSKPLWHDILAKLLFWTSRTDLEA